MSNQANGSWASAPFVTDKQFQNLSLDEIMQIIEAQKEGLKKDYKELNSRKRLIKLYKRLTKAREKVRKGIDIKKEYKKKKKIKTFEEYFEECIKNKEIPPDTPEYLRKSLERALYEHEQEIKTKKSALNNLAITYIFEGIPGLRPAEFFSRIYASLIILVEENRNVQIKFSFGLFDGKN